MKTPPFTIILSGIILIINNTFSQGVAINESGDPASSHAILDISSDTKGILIPRMSATERNILGESGPEEGMLVYDSDSSAFYYYNNEWVRLAGGNIISTTHSVIINEPLVLGENALVYNDFRVPASSAKTGGSGVPPFNKVTSLGNIYEHFFQDISVQGNEQSLYFNIQMPHTWKKGSAIYPHVHWMPASNTSGTVRWCVEYTWVNINGSFGPTNTICGNQYVSAQQFRHFMTAINSSPMDASGKNNSSMLLCRIYRNSSSTEDTYTGDAILLEFDIHFQVDKLGEQFTPGETN